MDTPSDTVTSEGTSASRFTVNVLNRQTGVAVANGAVRYHNGADVAKDDDDDDDDDDNWKPWAIVGVIGGAIAVVVVIIALSDDDETVSRVR